MLPPTSATHFTQTIRFGFQVFNKFVFLDWMTPHRTNADKAEGESKIYSCEYIFIQFHRTRQRKCQLFSLDSLLKLMRQRRVTQGDDWRNTPISPPP